MIKRALLAIIVLSFCSAPVFAQDIFFSFTEGAVSPNGTVDLSDGTGTAFVYSTSGFDFNGFDLDYTNSDTSVIEVTSGTVFNPVVVAGLRRFNMVAGQPVDIIVGELNLDPVSGTPDGSGGNLFGVQVSGAVGINGANFSGDDPLFDPNVGANGAFLLAQVDFNIVGEGTADLTFSLGDNGIIDFGVISDPNDDQALVPVFGSGFLTVTNVPEPSSAGLLVLGLAGIFARRRR